MLKIDVFREFENAPLMAEDEEVYLQRLRENQVLNRRVYSAENYIQDGKRIQAGQYSRVASWAYWDPPQDGDYVSIKNMYLNQSHPIGFKKQAYSA